MSEEMKNMSDINDQQTADQTERQALEQMAEQQAFSEEIRRRLAEPDSGKPTLEEFKVMVYKDREKRRKKRNTMVACVVAAFVVGLFSFEYFVPEVGADKNPKETIKTEDGVIIEDGGWGSSEENNAVTIENWNDVSIAKKHYSQMLIPQYIPAEYEFKYVTIENVTEKNIVCKYLFVNNNINDNLEIEIIVTDGGEGTHIINDPIRQLESKKGQIYVVNGQNKIATIQIDDGVLVYIWSNLEDEELLKLVDNLED